MEALRWMLRLSADRLDELDAQACHLVFESEEVTTEEVFRITLEKWGDPGSVDPDAAVRSVRAIAEGHPRVGVDEARSWDRFKPGDMK